MIPNERHDGDTYFEEDAEDEVTIPLSANILDLPVLH